MCSVGSLLRQKEDWICQPSLTSPKMELPLCCLVFHTDLVSLEPSGQPPSPSWCWCYRFQLGVPYLEKEKGKDERQWMITFKENQRAEERSAFWVFIQASRGYGNTVPMFKGAVEHSYPRGLCLMEPLCCPRVEDPGRRVTSCSSRGLSLIPLCQSCLYL